MNSHFQSDIALSIKSSFVKGAGAHPQNAPCRRRSHALRSAPVKRGRLLSTVLHRWYPRLSMLSAGLRWTTHFQILLHALIPSLLRPPRTPPPRDWPGPHPIYLTIGTHDMSRPPKPTLPNQNGKVGYPQLGMQIVHWWVIRQLDPTNPADHSTIVTTQSVRGVTQITFKRNLVLLYNRSDFIIPHSQERDPGLRHVSRYFSS